MPFSATTDPARTTGAQARAGSPAVTARDGASSHTVVLPVPPELASTVLDSRLRRLASRSKPPDSIRCYVEQVPLPHDDPRAERRREQEIGRAVDAERIPLRAVLLVFSDRRRDLVLVGHRSRVGRAGLGRLARFITSACGSEEDEYLPDQFLTVCPDVEQPLLWDCERRCPPSWGVPEPTARGTLSRPLPAVPGPAGGGGRAAVLAALCLVLDRYVRDDCVEFLLLDSPEATRCLRGFSLAIDPEEHLSALARRAERRLLADDVSEVSNASELSNASVAVVLSQGSRSEKYTACLAPIRPLTVSWEFAEDGTVFGTLHADTAAVHPRVVEQLAGQLDRAVRAVLAAAEPAEPTEPAAAAAAADGSDRAGGEPAARPRGRDLPALDPPEVAAVLAAADVPAPPNPLPVSIGTAFARIADRHPHKVALSGEQGDLTYAELHDAAQNGARVLRRQGVEPGDRVGICLEREAGLVVAMLSVLMAGATYVPMDPQYPSDRLAWTAADAGARTVITRMAEFPGAANVLDPDRLTESAVPGRDDDAGQEPTAPPAAAYAIYTSGSTGRPKGVLVPHSNVLSLVSATRADLRLGPADVWTLFHSSAFDFSVWEIWGCLLTGGTLVVVPYWVSRSPKEFRRLLVHRRVTVLNQTPSAFAALVEADRSAAGDLSVRLVVFGGEALDVALLRPWFHRHSHLHCRLVNMYGITETTVHVTAQSLTPADVAAGSRSVGRPLPGWRVSVRDVSGGPLPFGAPGEIWVGGRGVALGYLGRPDLTASRFLDDPVSGHRFYRSGDLGRLHPDGRLDHLGRIDNQVKLRGFRIELDEIRSVFLEHSSVSAAAVVLVPGPDGDRARARLDAFVVGPGPDTVPTLRAHAARSLPDYMMPSRITVLGDLPRTVNGKTDTARLVALAGEAAETPSSPSGTTDDCDREVLPNRTGQGAELDSDVRRPLHRLTAILTDLFERAVVAEDDFFEMGGNSLLAVRLSRAVEQAGLPRFSLHELYLNPTPSRLASLLESRQEVTAP
ncbi:MAG: hypothetical protein QG608_2421 [Actinomycetota bacterium]|nr:hypothetical protein [Actinomycetota bacterium]